MQRRAVLGCNFAQLGGRTRHPPPRYLRAEAHITPIVRVICCPILANSVHRPPPTAHRPPPTAHCSSQLDQSDRMPKSGDRDDAGSLKRLPPRNPTQQPNQADISGLIEKFSSVYPSDFPNVKEEPQPGVPTRPSPYHRDSSEDAQSSSSGDETDSGLADRHRWDVIDQIMKSFCVSLDSKIAAISSTTVKKEREPPRSLSLVKTPTSKISSTTSRSRKKSSLGGSGQPQPSAVASGAESSPGNDASVGVRGPVVDRRTATKPQAQGQSSAAPAPPPPPAILSRGPASLSFHAPISPSPVASIVSAPRPSTTSALEVSAIESIVSDAGASRTYHRGANKTNSSLPHVRSHHKDQVREGQRPPAPELEKGEGSEPASKQLGIRSSVARSRRVEPEEHNYSSHPGESSTPSSGGETAGPEVCQVEVAETSFALPNDRPTGQNVAVGSGELSPERILEMLSAEILPDGMPAVPSMLGLPTDSFGDGGIWNPYLQMAITPLPNVGIPDASRMYAPTTPPEDLPEGPKPAQTAKRVAHEDISTRDADNVARGTEDGDGRRKKAKRAPTATVAGLGSGARKFACPYFKRNPKKYRNWTSCPGPGWEEVHRVKYVVRYF